MIKVLANATAVSILQYKCIKLTFCTPETYTMLYINYTSINFF